MEFIRDIVTVASMGLTFTTIIACMGVLYLWWEAAWRAWKASHRTEVNWFVLGVVIGFGGGIVDNVYWGFAWFAELVSHPYRDALFDNGVYANLIFRQLATIAAAVCHIRAAISTDSYRFRAIVFGGWALGIAMMVPMFIYGEIG